MEPLFKLCADDVDDLLPQIKKKLMTGVGSAQVRAIEHISTFLRNSSEPNRDVIVRKLVKFDIISTMCDVMQTSDESFVKIVFAFFDLVSVHRGFYENHAAVIAVESMLRLSYCVTKSLKDSALFERLLQSICGVLVRSSELSVDIDNVCIPGRIIRFLKNLDFRDSQKDNVIFAAVAMLNVVLQQAVFDESVDEEMVIDVCRDALRSMTELIKYGNDDSTILLARLCGTCAGGSRYCNIDFEQEQADDSKLQLYQKKLELSNCIYDTVMSVIVPHVKDTDLSYSVEFHRHLVSCLNNLYQLRSCNHDDLSNLLTANGYLKYFLHLTVQHPNNLRRNICTLLSRILSILGKTAFSDNTTKFANILYQGLLELPKDSADQWKNIITYYRKDGTALMILLYYHFHGTREHDMAPLESLIAKVVLLPKSGPISVLILKPLWLLFAVSSISHPHPNLINNYEIAVARLTSALQCAEIAEFYTHHIDLLHHCFKCPSIPPSLVNQVLDLWLVESDGDITLLLPFNCDYVVRRLLVVVQIGYPQHVISLATKGLRHLIRVGKDSRYTEQIADIVWHILPNILSSHQSNTVTHIEAALELANIVQPHTLPIHLITRSANSVVDIILKKIKDLKFMILVVTQAYVLLDAAMSRESFKVLQVYTEKLALLKKLCDFGFSEEECSELSAISVKLLAFIIHCQRKSPIKCKQSLEIHVESLVELLTHAKKSPCRVTNGLQFICELLTQKIDRSAVVLQKIAVDSIDVDTLINLYEMLHLIHVQKYPMERDIVYQSLKALLHYCNNDVNVPQLVPHLCTVMSNYDLIFNVVNMRYVSSHFVEFVTTWLHYRKATCNDTPWNFRSLPKTPFDEILDGLREYSAIVNETGLKEAYLNLQCALLQFE